MWCFLNRKRLYILYMTLLCMSICCMHCICTYGYCCSVPHYTLYCILQHGVWDVDACRTHICTRTAVCRIMEDVLYCCTIVLYDILLYIVYRYAIYIHTGYMYRSTVRRCVYVTTREKNVPVIDWQFLTITQKPTKKVNPSVKWLIQPCFFSFHPHTIVRYRS